MNLYSHFYDNTHDDFVHQKILLIFLIAIITSSTVTAFALKIRQRINKPQPNRIQYNSSIFSGTKLYSINNKRGKKTTSNFHNHHNICYDYLAQQPLGKRNLESRNNDDV